MCLIAGNVRAYEGEAMPSADDIIKKLELKPLSGEGGYFRETYKSDIVLPASTVRITSQSIRHISTAIYYLVTPESFSALHRVKSDEVFHVYAGDPVEMIQIDKFGTLIRITLGSDVLNGQSPQVVVPGGTWQGLKLKAGGKWALMGATVSPGFEFEDFELGDQGKMVQLFPHLRGLIGDYTMAS
jgi:uncharacterized protein